MDLHPTQRNCGLDGKRVEATERFAVHRQRARGEPAFDPQVLEMTLQVVVERGRIRRVGRPNGFASRSVGH
jgi:hypothetical protein